MWNAQANASVEGWLGGAIVLGKRPVPGRPTILITVGQGPIALAVGAGGVFWIFLLSSILSLLSPSLWETARYRLKYCLKGPSNPKQPTNQPTNQKLPSNLCKTIMFRYSVLQGNSIRKLSTNAFSLVSFRDLPTPIKSRVPPANIQQVLG